MYKSTVSEGSSGAMPLPPGECGDWFVLRTRSRQEKILAGDLQAKCIGFFLPLKRVQRTYCGRHFQVEMPMFPCYLFLRGALDDAYWADRTGRVAQIIPVSDQPRLQVELTSLARAMSSTCKLDPFPYIKKGTRVEIRSGSLKGIQGLVEDRNRRDRIILQVEALGRAVSVELDAAIVDVID
jgi:transcription antitermination factor NusG